VRAIRIATARDDRDRDLAMPQTDVTRFPAISPATTGSSGVVVEQARLEAVAAEVARRRTVREAAAAALGVPPTIPLQSPPMISAGATRAMISLRNPSRQSAVVRVIVGEIDLFTPSVENGGIVSLNRVTARPGETLASKELEESGVQAVYFTQRTLDSHSAVLGDAKSMMQAALKAHGPDAVFIAMRDPKRVVVDFELQDAAGHRLLTNPFYGGSAEWTRSLFLKAPPADDVRLILRITSKGAVKAHPFKLENVPLP
jgi:hypothetical protein